MSTSDQTAFVWAFLPGQSIPVVAGRLGPSRTLPGLAFQYARSYLARPDAMSLGPDLPLDDAAFPPAAGHNMPSSIRDAMPDSWGQQVINRELGSDLEETLPDLRYMLESGSDRVGALDFQASPTEYLSRGGNAALKAIADGALAVEDPENASPNLSRAVRNTLTAAGGSQPKAFVTVEGQPWLAKFQTSYDGRSPIIKAERAALHIAERAGIPVPRSRLVRIADQPAGQDLALLTKRFDRTGAEDGTASARLQVLSGLTIAEDYRASGASYPKLIERLRRLSPVPQDAGRELFRRLAFRIAMRVDDDHLRNVAFFWDGEHANITPAFDLSADLVATPTGLTDLGDGTREFSLAALVSQHRHYHVTRREAQEIADEMVEIIVEHRAAAADIALMTEHEKQLLMTRTTTRELIGGPVSVTPGAALRRHPELSAAEAVPQAPDDEPELG